MRTEKREMLKKFVTAIAVTLIIVALVASLSNKSFHSLAYFALFAMLATINLPQIAAILQGETLAPEDSSQVFWWMFGFAALSQFVTVWHSCTHHEYLGALTTFTIGILLVFVALPYRMFAFHRTGYSRRKRMG